MKERKRKVGKGKEATYKWQDRKKERYKRQKGKGR